MMVLTVIIEYIHLGRRDNFSEDAHVTSVEWLRKSLTFLGKIKIAGQGNYAGPLEF